MRIVDDILFLLTAGCRSASDAILSGVIKTARRICMMAWLLAVASALLLGALGLMIAALFIALVPCVGVPWSAMIASGASLGCGGILMAVAIKMSNSR
jgi:hypothetical protein